MTSADEVSGTIHTLCALTDDVPEILVAAGEVIDELQERVAELTKQVEWYESAIANDLLRAERAEADLAAARAESDLACWLLRNARKYMNPMHEALCAAIDNVLQKKQASLAGGERKDAT
jgi:hypothetical protein